MTTEPTRARPRAPTATTACQGGFFSSRSCSTRAPRITLTTGLATETAATEGTSRPVESDNCWNRKPTIPAAAQTQNCQPETTVLSDSVWRLSTTGFINVAESPYSSPAIVPSNAAFTDTLPRLANTSSETHAAQMTRIEATQSE